MIATGVMGAALAKWREAVDAVDENPEWQDRIYYILAGAYAVVGIIALV